MDNSNPKRLNEDLLNRAFDRVIGTQIDKLTKKEQVKDAEQDDYRKNMALEREKASKRKREYATDEHVEKARTTGLSVEVIALMEKQARHEEDPEDVGSSKEKQGKRNKKRRDSSDDSSRSSDEKKKHKRKKRKHSKKSSRRKHG